MVSILRRGFHCICGLTLVCTRVHVHAAVCVYVLCMYVCVRARVCVYVFINVFMLLVKYTVGCHVLLRLP